MADQYPPPPADSPQYNAMYAASAGTELVEAAQQQGIQLNGMPMYPGAHGGSLQQPGSAGGQNGSQMGPPPDTPQRAGRMRKACDACSSRKVKCDNEGPPCKPCAALQIDCTFSRPTKRRGPPNKYAESVKRQKVEAALNPSAFPDSPTSAAHTLTSLSTNNRDASLTGQKDSTLADPTLSMESIGHRNLILDLARDYFTYIHPLCPFPHEPSFMKRVDEFEDLRNPEFLALFSSMIGVLATSFPRKVLALLHYHGVGQRFPTQLKLIDHCHDMALHARGWKYTQRDDHDIDEACTSYFLGLIAAYTERFRAAHLAFTECLCFLQSPNINRMPEPPTDPQMAPFSSPTPGPVDCIKEEMRRRLFWTAFVGFRSMQQVGIVADLPSPLATAHHPYPPLPAEVDDHHLYPDHADTQPAGTVSLMRAFNLNVRIFLSYETLTRFETAYGTNSDLDLDYQKSNLAQSLSNCKALLVDLPRELKLDPRAQPAAAPDFQLLFPGFANPGDAGFSANVDPALSDPEADRRKAQFEIQKANVYASFLSTRCYVADKSLNLCAAYQNKKQQSPEAPGSTIPHSEWEAMEQEMKAERDEIIMDLLNVIGSISQVNMEPNAKSFSGKVRFISSTLLDVARNRESEVAIRAEEYMAKFLDILVRLERHEATDLGFTPTKMNSTEVETQQKWLDLREYQRKLAEGRDAVFLNQQHLG